MSSISDYINIDNSLVYTSTHRVREIAGSMCVEIDLIMIDTKIARFRYFYDLDLLIIGDYTQAKYEIKNFSTINTEERYFQQMSVQDCTAFEYHEVDRFMSLVKEIIINET